MSWILLQSSKTMACDGANINLTFFSVRCAICCFWLMSLDKVLEAVMTVIAVSFSRMFPSAPESTSMILSSISASWRAFSAPCTNAHLGSYHYEAHMLKHTARDCLHQWGRCALLQHCMQSVISTLTVVGQSMFLISCAFAHLATIGFNVPRIARP